MPFFSIILPTYNAEDTIYKCVSSILDQSCSDFEVIIQDGGSTDKTLKILSDLSDERIRVESRRDGGIYDAMNQGINRASGNWLYFLGSDDSLYDSCVLSKVKKIIKDNRQIDVFYGDVKIVGDCNWAKNGERYKGAINLSDLFYENICHQSIFYNIDLFQQTRYSLEFPICSDYHLNLLFYSRKTFKYMDIIIANYSVYGISNTNLDHRFYEKKWELIIQIYGFRLFNKSFYIHKTNFKKLMRKYWFAKNTKLALKTFLLYLYLKSVKYFR